MLRKVGINPHSGLVQLLNNVQEASVFIAGSQIKEHQAAGQGHPGKRGQSKCLHQARLSHVLGLSGSLNFINVHRSSKTSRNLSLVNVTHLAD
jgi:hypothetical protein